MLRFFLKRVGIGAIILFGATFIVYMLLAYAINPLAELAEYNGADKQAKIEAFTRKLDLNTPPLLRYFKWLGGILGFFVGRGTFGFSVSQNANVSDALLSAIPTTLSLVFTATILAIIFGIAVGVITALRQYSSFDYFITFVSFFLYSLPSFWIAILLKQYGAISFNDFLKDPVVSLPFLISISLFIAFLVFLISRSDLKRKLIFSAFSFIFTCILLEFASITNWFSHPGLTVVGVMLLSGGVISILSWISIDSEKTTFIKGGILTGIVGVLWVIAQLVFRLNSIFGVLITLSIFISVGVIYGVFAGKEDKRVYMRVYSVAMFVAFCFTFIDRMMNAWYPYMKNSSVDFRPIGTIGSSTPGITGNFWIMTMDGFTHLLLPTLALLLMGFAGYTRYTRSSMLEVLNADYIRTARAKGLPERVVVSRHALKNAILPLATMVPADLAGMVGGAVITEKIFSWKGMGSFFIQSLQKSDFNGVMGCLVITSALAIIANIVSDMLYAVLDPRIRLQ